MRYDLLFECLKTGFCLALPCAFCLLCVAISNNCIIFSYDDRAKRKEIIKELNEPELFRFLNVKIAKKELFKLNFKKFLDNVINYISDFILFKKKLFANIIAFVLIMIAIFGVISCIGIPISFFDEKNTLKQFNEYKTFVEQKEEINLKEKYESDNYNKKIMESLFIDKDKIELIDLQKIEKKYLKGIEKNEISRDN